MKDYAEIKDIITNKLGIHDLQSYNEWIAPFYLADPAKRRLVTQEDIDLLSPDVVNNRDFWLVAEELFGADPVAACGNNTLPNDVDEGNRRNMDLARHMGMLNFIDSWRHYRLPVLEIGAGYGNFKNYCLFNSAYQYKGVDVYPRIPGIIATTPGGFLPDSIKQEKFQIVYSSNVFQHLSRKQRSVYFEDVKGMLRPDGIFIFNLLVHFDDPANPVTRSAVDGRKYLMHYGQMTEIPYVPEFETELKQHFKMLYQTRRFTDYFFTYVCTAKETPNPERV